MPSWIGPWEIAIVLIIALLIFGPRKLPELGSSLGKSIRGFRKGLKEHQEEIQSTVADVRQVTGIDEMKSAVTEVRQAAGLDEVKSMVTDLREAVNVKSELKEALTVKPESVDAATPSGPDTPKSE